MANTSVFTEFDTEVKLLSTDWIVGVNVEQTGEIRVQLSDLINNLKGYFTTVNKVSSYCVPSVKKNNVDSDVIGINAKSVIQVDESILIVSTDAKVNKVSNCCVPSVKKNNVVPDVKVEAVVPKVNVVPDVKVESVVPEVNVVPDVKVEAVVPEVVVPEAVVPTEAVVPDVKVEAVVPEVNVVSDVKV